MASLCIPRSELHVGIDWSGSAAVARALSDGARPPILLYPGPGAIDIMRDPPPRPVTLVVIDGTWAQTKKILRMNPLLAALPRYAFVPPEPSEYRIRREPDDASVATIEALVHALAAIEGDGERFRALLDPFRKMIDFQIECEARFHGTRSRHAKRRARIRRHGVPRALTDRAPSLVCVAAEANAWPYAMRTHPTHPHPEELVHWAAYRPRTGETLTLIARPQGDLAPGTAAHTGLDAAVLMGGTSLTDVHARWREFVRSDDVICSWGRYETELFVASGGYLPESRIDLRRVARNVARGNVGPLSRYREEVGGIEGSEPASVIGRAGRKLRALTDILAAFGKLTYSGAQLG
jgi:hypothetical protein